MILHRECCRSHHHEYQRFLYWSLNLIFSANLHHLNDDAEKSVISDLRRSADSLIRYTVVYVNVMEVAHT